MLVIGLLGGVASGKSLVSRQFEQLGAGILDADRAGHEALLLPHVEAAARARWGDGILGPDGHIDRRRLAAIVFANGPEAAGERKYLEKLTHPEIGRRLARQARAMEAAGRPAAVLDAALLIEAGWDKLCQKFAYVDAPVAVRRGRAQSRGWSEEEFAAREGAQESLDSKRRRADVTIDNSGSPAHTQAQVERFWHALVG
jgi:dephospho-CoA kinase